MMRRFYADVEMAEGRVVSLGAEESRHVRDVLRLRIGDTVALFDGRGREFEACIAELLKKETQFRVVREVAPSAPESNLRLTLAAALLKSDKFDLVVQKAVELGVSELIPLVTRRTDLKLRDLGSRVERWRKIALEACKQCGRAQLMSIGLPLEFPKFCFEQTGNGSVAVFSERGGSSFQSLSPNQSMTAVTGPEGGWDDAELDLAKTSGFAVITLGGRILRAETAAVSAAAILQHRFGDLN